MQEKKFSNAKRITALLTAAVIAAVFSLSALFIAENSNHTCTHQDCQVCQQISNSIKFFSNDTPQPQANTFLNLNIFALVLLMGAISSKKVLSTEITLKDKLLN